MVDTKKDEREGVTKTKGSLWTDFPQGTHILVIDQNQATLETSIVVKLKNLGYRGMMSFLPLLSHVL